MTDQATVRTVEHGDASEIPAARWFWRRWYVIALTAAVLGLIAWLTREITDVITLRMTIRYLCWTLLSLVFVYVAGATATDCVNMVSVLRSTRRETVTTAPPPAQIRTPEAIVTTDAGELPPDQRVQP
jgi:membrane glycosyltransferase